MIVPMKRITILGLKSHTDDIVKQLQEMGVVHVTPVHPSESPQLENIADLIFLSKMALEKLPATTSTQSEPLDALRTVNSIVELAEELEIREDDLGNLEMEQERISFLGDFNFADIAELERRGIFITLYELPYRNNKNNHSLKELPCIVLNGHQAKRPVMAVVSYKKRVNLDFETFTLPRLSPEEIRKQMKLLKSEYQEIQSQITEYSQYKKAIELNLLDLYDTRDFELVRSGLGTNEEIVYLRGYCPVNKSDSVRDSAGKNAWGLLIEDPTPEEDPPTLVQNPKWVEMIKPVFLLLNTLPGYHELDISAVFLIFFSIFFGMIIGDAGYGVLFLVVTAVAQKQSGNRVNHKELFSLMYVLSIATILWGAITGNWFGIEWLTSIEPFETFIIPPLNAYTASAQDLVMNISFYIAVVHLSLAHVLVIAKDFRVCNVLTNTGWIMMVWVMFFIAQNQVMGTPLPDFFPYLLLSAGILIAIFSILGRKPGKGLAEIVIADVILATINTFADTISYIRLFAVGLATLAVAQSFNDIALQVGFGNAIAVPVSALILICGHALNIALAAMAVIVHGVRLNMLEFSGHVGNTWSGYGYKPFGRSVQTDETIG